MRLLANGVKCELLTQSDESTYLQLYMSSAVMHHIGPTLTHQAASASFQQAIHLNAMSPWSKRFWSIRGSANQPLGIMMLRRNNTSTLSAEAGIMLLPTAIKKGIARAAFKAMINAGFDTLGLTSVLVVFHSDNLAMKRLAQRLGFRLLPTEAPKNAGHFHQAALYPADVCNRNF